MSLHGVVFPMNYLTTNFGIVLRTKYSIVYHKNNVLLKYVLIYHNVLHYPPHSTVLFAILNRLSTGRTTQYCL